MGRKAHRIYQEILLWIQYPFQILINRIFRLGESYRFFVARSKGNYSNTELYDLIAEMLREADDIKIAFGEIGHRMVDNPIIINALTDAYLNNNANIEILHGPRVDPETKRIFELGKLGVVKLYTLPKYRRRHFIIAHRSSGEVGVLDEGAHNEALWEQTVEGKPKQVYSSRYRIYFIRKNSYRLAKKLQNEFKVRRAGGWPTDLNNPPGYAHPYKHPLLRTIALGLIHVPLRWFIQPFEQALDIAIRNPYEVSVRGRGSSRPRESIMNTPEHKAEVPRTTQIARALGMQENGLESVFLLKIEGPASSDQIVRRFTEEQLTATKLPQTLLVLEKTGLIQQREDGAYILTEEGTATAEKLLNFKPRKSKDVIQQRDQ